MYRIATAVFLRYMRTQYGQSFRESCLRDEMRLQVMIDEVIYMVKSVKTPSDRIRSTLQHYPEYIARKYDKNIHNQVLRLSSTLEGIMSLCADVYSAQYIKPDDTVRMQNLVTAMMQDWYVVMERLETFCNEMRADGYRVGYSMSSYLQGLRSARAEVVHHSEPVFDYKVSRGSYACYTDSAATPYCGECLELYVIFNGPKGAGRTEELSGLVDRISREVANALTKTLSDLENSPPMGHN